jgi:hypothetical protein
MAGTCVGRVISSEFSRSFATFQDGGSIKKRVFQRRPAYQVGCRAAVWEETMKHLIALPPDSLLAFAPLLAADSVIHLYKLNESPINALSDSAFSCTPVSGLTGNGIPVT